MKRKTAAILFCLALILLVALPETLATTSDSDGSSPNEATPVQVSVSVGEEPGVILPTVSEPTSTCDTENDPQAADCALHTESEASLFDRLMDCTSREEFDALIAQTPEEERNSFTCEEFDQLEAHYHYLSTGEPIDHAPIVDEGSATVNFTNVAPLVGSGD